MSRTGEIGSLSTPPRANEPAHGASTLKSTPSSRGAAVVSEHISILGVRVKKLRPWIQRDIDQTRQCKADAMLQALLQRASSAPETEQPELLQKCLQAVLPVCNGEASGDRGIHSSGIQTALKTYVRSGLESNLYRPFIEATNIALACLEEIKVDGMGDPVLAVDMICQQNDMPMIQTHQTETSTRKPDLVFLPLNSACSAFQAETGSNKGNNTVKKENDQKDDTMENEGRKKKRKAHMDTNATAKPKNLPWKDILACLEFKRKTKNITSPPSSYTVKDYVATQPEHLPVDHVKAEGPAPGPAQTPQAPPASDTAAKPSGGSSSKRAAVDVLEPIAKKFKTTHDDTDSDLDVTVQTGLYAAEMFASNIAVNHLLNIIVVDDVMWIWYYDRQGIIQCSGINFIQDLPRFMVLLYALQRFELHDWGRNKEFLPVNVEGKQCHELKIEDKDLGTVELLLHTSHNERVTHYGLQGRATNVVPVTSEAVTKKYPNVQAGMVAKIFWGEVSRTSEPEILDKVGKIAGAHESVKGHIPELLWHHTFANPTSAIREALGIPEPTTGCRVLYILVFRKLKPITELLTSKLFDVWYQCILCHITLWKEGVFHRDISPGNLMYYEKDKKLIGVLNDYDLSSLAGDPGPRGNERTGTVPFMALDLLTEEGQRGEVTHLYRHDLESFMWCFAWISFRYNDGVLRPWGSRPFDEWATLEAVACGEKKYFLQGHMKKLPSLHLNKSIRAFIVACFMVLKREADDQYDRLPIEDLSDSEADQLPTESDPDAFLSKFTRTGAWRALSEGAE